MANKPPELLTSLQCRAARAALQWGLIDLSKRSGVGTTTISRFEKQHSKPIRANLSAIRQAFEAAGVEFIDGTGVNVNGKPAGK